MSSLSFLSWIAALTYTSRTSLSVYKHTLRHALHRERSAFARNYGPGVAILFAVCWPNLAAQYDRVDKSILNSETEEEALAFRQAVIDECNMTAIAGAIIAQVAITALSLSSLSSTRWVARACCIVAITSGCLSVYYACEVGRIVGRLYKAKMIKDWLRLPPPSKNGVFSKQPTDASLAAVIIVSAPFALVKVSILAFLLGLAIYQGFVFSKDLDKEASPNGSRNIFIALMVGTGLCFLFYRTTFLAKDIESLMRFYADPRMYLTGEQEDKGSSIAGAASGGVLGAVKRDAAVQKGVQEPRPIPQVPVEEDTEKNTGIDPILRERPQKQPSKASHTGAPNSTPELIAAMEAAAKAHRLCAEAEQRVAFEYSRLPYNE